MTTQDLKAEKLDLIAWIAQVQDVSLIEKLKQFRGKNSSESLVIPEWQKEIVRERVEKSKNNPDILLEWEEVKNDFNFD
ncbi:MAG: hypothetical protein JKY53_04765 [Flavobacteriales bacterium]|nr:hypothetical protein [Flavobacteriales bacterium]